MVRHSHTYMTSGKIIALSRWTLVGKVIRLLFNMLSRLVITFLPRSKHLLISWLQSTSAVILETKKIKSLTVPTVSPSIWHGVMGPDAMISVFWMLSFKSAVSSSSCTFLERLFSSSSLSAIRVVSSAYLSLLIFLPAFSIPDCALVSHRFMYVPSFSHLPPLTLPYPSRCHRALDLNYLHDTANSHWLSNFTYGNIYVPVLLSQFVSPSPSPNTTPFPQRPGYKSPWNS